MKIIKSVMLVLLVVLFTIFNLENCVKIKSKLFKKTLLKHHKNLYDPFTTETSNLNKLQLYQNQNKHGDHTGYSTGDNTFVRNTPLYELPKEETKKHDKFDDLPVIWTSGPNAGKIMTKDDFGIPFGRRYSDHMYFKEKSSHTNLNLKSNKNKVNNKSSENVNVENKYIIDPRSSKNKGKK